MNIEMIDGLVIALYLVGIFTVAIIAGKKSHSDSETSDNIARDKFLANKSLTFTESLSSIIATEVSALTFLGIPAFAFNANFSFIQIYLGAILGRLVIAKVFLPKVYDQGLTIYEVMAKDTGLPSGQRTVAIIYTFSKILSVGVRLFSGSILVGQFLGLDVYGSLILVSSVTFLYTLIGGLKAVVRTDVLQLGLFVSGGLIAHYLIPDLSGKSWGELMSMAHIAGKTSFFSFENPMGFVFGFMGGILFDMSTHGVDQDFAQRLTANESLRKAQLAIFFSSFLSITVGLIFLGVGALLWAHYQSHPFPEGIPNADHLFSHFIVNYFPVGVRGVMVGGVLAATMSTLDSTINALCSTVYNDIIPKRWESDVNRTSFIYTLIITVVLTLIAVIASKNDGLLLLGLKIQSWTGGALLGLFLTKVIFKNFFPYRMDAPSVIGAYAFGVAGVYMNTVLGWDWNLNVYWGCGMSMLFLKIYSRLRPFRAELPR